MIIHNGMETRFHIYKIKSNSDRILPDLNKNDSCTDNYINKYQHIQIWEHFLSLPSRAKRLDWKTILFLYL